MGSTSETGSCSFCDMGSTKETGSSQETGSTSFVKQGLLEDRDLLAL